MTLKRKGLKRTGPLPGPFQPSRLKYKCPVFECKSAKIRGDRIAEHFQSFANLIVLDKCNENVQLLRKNNLPAGNIIEKSDELLKSLMASATASEKFHTKYLYENGFSSMNLPTHSSKNFKNQHKVPLNAAWKGFSLVPKGAKSSEEIPITPDKEARSDDFVMEEIPITVSRQAPDKEAWPSPYHYCS